MNECEMRLRRPEHLCGCVQHRGLAETDYPGYLRIFISGTLLLKLQPYQT